MPEGMTAEHLIMNLSEVIETYEEVLRQYGWKDDPAASVEHDPPM